MNGPVAEARRDHLPKKEDGKGSKSKTVCPKSLGYLRVSSSQKESRHHYSLILQTFQREYYSNIDLSYQGTTDSRWTPRWTKRKLVEA